MWLHLQAQSSLTEPLLSLFSVLGFFYCWTEGEKNVFFLFWVFCSNCSVRRPRQHGPLHPYSKMVATAATSEKGFSRCHRRSCWWHDAAAALKPCWHGGWPWTASRECGGGTLSATLACKIRWFFSPFGPWTLPLPLLHTFLLLHLLPYIIIISCTHIL